MPNRGSPTCRTTSAASAWTSSRHPSGARDHVIFGRNEVGNTGAGNTIKDYGGGIGDAVPGMPGQTKQWEWLGEHVLDN